MSAVSTLFSSMFLHGSFMHLAGNMLYLWIFGNNIEDVLGHVRYLIFYLLCGVIAAMVQAVPDMDSSIPMIGASGAISGVLGAYLLLFPNVKVQVVIPIGFFIMRTLPAGWLLGFWIVFQVFSGFAAGVASSGVAWWAHVGGFVAGMALIYLFRGKTSDPTAAGSVGRSKSWIQPDRPVRRSRIPDTRSDQASDEPAPPPTVQRRRDP
jgi:membrane associated rhomboid family serine protease